MIRQRCDFFTLTCLPFDPPVNTKSWVIKRIDEAIIRLKNQLDIETQMTERKIFQSQLDFLNQQSMCINTTEWKEASKAIAKMADERKTQECKRIKSVASLLRQNGIDSLSEGAMRSFCLKTGLSKVSMIQVFETCGIRISPNIFMENNLKFPAYSERVLSELEILRSLKDPNPNGTDTSVVTDLYAFAAYIMDDLAHTVNYRVLSTDELKTVFGLASRKYSQRNDELGRLCASLSTTAHAYVFNNGANHKRYDLLMRYHNDDLQTLFDTLRLIPNAILLKSEFAEACIKRIMVFFPDYKTSLAIYNKEANLTEMPYLPPGFDRERTLTRIESNIKNQVHSGAKVFGMDLGTTYSVISTLDDNGVPEVITNQDEGVDYLASAVYFKAGADPVVGEMAKNQKDIEPERVVEFVKRYIGKTDAPTYEFDGVVYDPTTISSLILRRMKEYANAQGHDVKNVVITCPTYFSDEEKTATRHAGIIAGLNVLNIVYEPAAAVLSYLSIDEIKANKKILVYDLGGGTLDVTLFESRFNDEEKISLDLIRTDGNDRLGGIDWDARMFDYMCERYAFENGTEVSEMDIELKATIRAQVEQEKRDLSTLEKKSYTIKYDGDRTRIELSREEFEERTQDLVQQTMDFVHQLLSDVSYTPDNVDVVLLVGGSTLMPMIKNAVEALFPGKVRVEQPNLAVAKGAALFASLEWNECLAGIQEKVEKGEENMEEGKEVMGAAVTADTASQLMIDMPQQLSIVKDEENM